jgi:hypothetical protein
MLGKISGHFGRSRIDVGLSTFAQPNRGFLR